MHMRRELVLKYRVNSCGKICVLVSKEGARVLHGKEEQRGRETRVQVICSIKSFLLLEKHISFPFLILTLVIHAYYSYDKYCQYIIYDDNDTTNI